MNKNYVFSNTDRTSNYINSCDNYWMYCKKTYVFSNPQVSRHYIDSFDNYWMYCKEIECVQQSGQE